jgi:hypothetical protein
MLKALEQNDETEAVAHYATEHPPLLPPEAQRRQCLRRRG